VASVVMTLLRKNFKNLLAFDKVVGKSVLTLILFLFSCGLWRDFLHLYFCLHCSSNITVLAFV